MNLVDLVNQKHELERVNSYPDFRSGDTVSVHTLELRKVISLEYSFSKVLL